MEQTSSFIESGDETNQMFEAAMDVSSLVTHEEGEQGENIKQNKYHLEIMKRKVRNVAFCIMEKEKCFQVTSYAYFRKRTQGNIH